MYVYGVAPFVGVWIEIARLSPVDRQNSSLPLWECGLKLILRRFLFKSSHVAPFVGVWIEILMLINASDL